MQGISEAAMATVAQITTYVQGLLSQASDTSPHQIQVAGKSTPAKEESAPKQDPPKVAEPEKRAAEEKPIEPAQESEPAPEVKAPSTEETATAAEADGGDDTEEAKEDL